MIALDPAVPTTPARAGRAAILRVNPVTKLAAASVIAVTLVLSLDWVSALAALVLELPLLPFAGVPWRTLRARTIPLWIAAPFAGLTILLYGRVSGTVYFHALFATVSEGSIGLAAATVIRLFAIALPSIVLFLTIDLTELADGLAQVVHLPSRFVLGGLAGLRLFTLFFEDWKSLELARRARGVADTGRLRRLAGQAFALLVLSIRRGTKLATAMEARGFGGPARRTWARESTLGRADAVLFMTAAVIAAVAVTASVLAGTWSFIASA